MSRTGSMAAPRANVDGFPSIVPGREELKEVAVKIGQSISENHGRKKRRLYKIMYIKLFFLVQVFHFFAERG